MRGKKTTFMFLCCVSVGVDMMQVPGAPSKAGRRRGDDHRRLAPALRYQPPRLQAGLGGDGRDRVRSGDCVPGNRAGKQEQCSGGRRRIKRPWTSTRSCRRLTYERGLIIVFFYHPFFKPSPLHFKAYLLLGTRAPGGQICKLPVPRPRYASRLTQGLGHDP